MGQGAIGGNDFTARFNMAKDIGKNDTVRNSVARDIVADDHITSKELTDAGVVIPDMTHMSTNTKVRKQEAADMTSELSKNLQAIGFKPDAAEAMASKIIGLGTAEATTAKQNDNTGFIQSKQVDTKTVPNGTETVKVGETTKTEYTGVIDRKSWEAGIVKAQPPGWKPTYFKTDPKGINADCKDNFKVMIGKFGPTKPDGQPNPTGQADFRTAIHNGFPGAFSATGPDGKPKIPMTDADCDKLLDLMQNGKSTGKTGDIGTIQTLLSKIDPKFGEVLGENGGIDGKLGYKTTEACRMLDAAVGMVEKTTTVPVFETRDKTKTVPVNQSSQGKVDIDLNESPKYHPPRKKIHIDMPDIGKPFRAIGKFFENLFDGKPRKKHSSVGCPHF